MAGNDVYCGWRLKVNNRRQTAVALVIVAGTAGSTAALNGLPYSESTMLPLQAFTNAHRVLRDRIAHTPIIQSESFSAIAGAQVYFKLENIQNTGSFKIRGAMNKFYRSRQNIGKGGVVAASAGNHAQGVALAAGREGIPATIVMPEWVSISKQEATRSYGGNVVIHGTSITESLEKAAALAAARDMTFVHPFDDPDIIAGQGSIGLEILEDLPDVDTVIVPIGGGGLISGVGAVLKMSRPTIRVIGVQSAICPSALRALSHGSPIGIDGEPSIADGISVKKVGDVTYPYIAKFVDDIALVSEETIAEAMLKLLERKKILVEGSGAATLGALLNGTVSCKPSEKVLLLMSGGNVDIPLVGRIISRGLIHQGRLLRLHVTLKDVPGALAGLLATVARQKANVLHIYHDRNLGDLPINTTAVSLELETRSHDHGTTVTRALTDAGYAVQPGLWI
jgi:threonine dehydratase